MAPKSKRRKAASSKTRDWISGLPDLIIGEILSLLPTKQAVATSILSKRWRYLWTSLKNLDFDCWPWDHIKVPVFVEFVDTVLSKCTTQELQKFYLATYCCDSYVCCRWVNEAIIRNVQMLELHVPELPGSIFTCMSLTSLKCGYGVKKLLNIPGSFYLPKLKVLHVSNTPELTVIAQKLVSSCPALEDLVLEYVDFQSTFVISPPLLKRLTLHTRSYGSNEKESKLVIDAPQLHFLNIKCSNKKEIKLVIDAPQLQLLNIKSEGHVPCYVIKNVASGFEATIKVGKRKATDKETRFIVELLTQLSGAKSLTLDTSTLTGPGNADTSMLPIFNKMTLLKLKMGPFYGLEIISDLLQASPILEVFIVKLWDTYDDVELEQEELHEFPFPWVEPQHVPPCLSTCLRVVELNLNSNSRVYVQAKQELDMIKYLLGNGEVLQKIVLEDLGVRDCYKFIKKLCKFPRASRYCEVLL